jgi:hypothetical protein
MLLNHHDPFGAPLSAIGATLVASTVVAQYVVEVRRRISWISTS